MSPVQEITGITAADLGALLDAGHGAVVTLESGETCLAAHRAVLAKRSPVFAAMFSHDTHEASSGVVTIPDVEGPVLRQLLAYVYTLQVPQLPDMAVQLLAAADKYGLAELKAACERQVAAQLSVETAAATAVLAVRHSCDSLKQAAVRFVKNNLVDVMSTQGWADAMFRQPADLIEVSRLLAETSDTAAEESGASPCTITHLDADHSDQCPTADSAACTVDPWVYPSSSEDLRESLLSVIAPEESWTSPDLATQPASDHSDLYQKAASAALTTEAASDTAPPEDVKVSLLRRLSTEEKGRRLLEAARVGDVQEIESLLAAGADVRTTDLVSMTALHWAAREGHVEAARCLLVVGAAVDAESSTQSTPLHFAAWRGHGDVARLLVAAGANHSARNQYGYTPLHFAADRGHTDVAVTLLDAGADRGAVDSRGNTPLDVARENKHQQLVDLLTTS